MKQPNDDDPFRPMKLAIIAALVLVASILVLTACAQPPAAPEPVPPKAQFPADMALGCLGGWFVIGSESADQMVRLPIRCQEA